MRLKLAAILHRAVNKFLVPSQAPERVELDSLRTQQVRDLLAKIELEAGERAYLNEHTERMARTLARIPADASGPALELGSYLHMAAALRTLWCWEVKCSYFAGQPGATSKILRFADGEEQHFPVDLFDAERHPYPYEDATLGVVLCCEILEHLLRDPAFMLAECWRVLRPGGYLILTTPNVNGLYSVWKTLTADGNPQVFSQYHWPPQDDERPHVREYSVGEVRALVTALGFEVVSLSTESPDCYRTVRWVAEILRQNNLPLTDRGEQLYCVARKVERPAGYRDHFVPFLYSRPG